MLDQALKMRNAGCLAQPGLCTAQSGASLASLQHSLSGQCLARIPAPVRAGKVASTRRGSPCCATAEAPEDFRAPLVPRRRRAGKGINKFQASVAATADVCEQPSSEATLAGATSEVSPPDRGNISGPERSSMSKDAAQPEVYPWEAVDGSPSRNTSRTTSGDGSPNKDLTSDDKAKYMWLQYRRYLYEDPPQKPIVEVDRLTAGGSDEQAGPVIGPEEPPFQTTFTVLAERLQLWRTADSSTGEGESTSPGSRKQRRRRRGLAPTGLVDGDPLAATAATQSSAMHSHPLSAPSQRSRSRPGDSLPRELLSSSLYPLGPAPSNGVGLGSSGVGGTEDELESVNELRSSAFSFSSSPSPSFMRLGPAPASGSPAYRELVLGEPQARDALNLSQKQRPSGIARGTRAPITPPPASCPLPLASSHLRANSPGVGAGAQALERQRNAPGEAFCASQAVQDLLDVASAASSSTSSSPGPLAMQPPPKKASEADLPGFAEEVKRRRRRRSRVRLPAPGAAGIALSKGSRRKVKSTGPGPGAPGYTLAAGSLSDGESSSSIPPATPGRGLGAESPALAHPETGTTADPRAELSTFSDRDGGECSEPGTGSEEEELRALGAEVRQFMARHGLPLRMPTRKELRSDFDHGLPLEKWIQRAGGAYACSQRLGIPMPHTRRPKGYWQQAANLEQQV